MDWKLDAGANPFPLTLLLVFLSQEQKNKLEHIPRLKSFGWGVGGEREGRPVG